MANQAERALVQHLTIESSLRYVIESNLKPEMLTDETIAKIFQWVLDYWYSAEQDRAPSPEALKMTFEAALAEHEIDVDIDPEDTVQWAVGVLQGAYVNSVTQPWLKQFAMDLAMSGTEEKPAVLTRAIEDLMVVHSGLVRRNEQVQLLDGMVSRVEAHEDRARARLAGTWQGARFGLPEVDEHIHLVHPGELCIVAGGPKVGKSWMLLMMALAHWLAGGSPILYTLENSVEATLDRIAFLHLGIDARAWNEGRAPAEEVEKVRTWIENVLKPARNPFTVMMPAIGQRSAEALVRHAKNVGDAVFIDQLTFVEAHDERKARHEQIREVLHEMKALISTGSRIPCVLAHQISREGVKAAEKVGYLEMYHMAEGSEVERTADLAFALWQSAGLREAGRAYLQMLAARRVDLKNWEMLWRPWTGQIMTRGEINLRGDD